MSSCKPLGTHPATRDPAPNNFFPAVNAAAHHTHWLTQASRDRPSMLGSTRLWATNPLTHQLPPLGHSGSAETRSMRLGGRMGRAAHPRIHKKSRLNSETCCTCLPCLVMYVMLGEVNVQPCPGLGVITDAAGIGRSHSDDQDCLRQGEGGEGYGARNKSTSGA